MREAWRDLGLSASELGRQLGMSERTARHLVQQAARSEPPKPLGRKPKRLSPEQRATSLEYLKHDQHLGMPILQLLLPEAPTNALEELIWRVRAAQRRRKTKPSTLRWHEAGIAWAIDATDLSEPYAGIFKQLIVVRGLFSHKILAAQMVLTACASDTIRLLSSLFGEHGAPLILKYDNGGAFTAAEVGSLLESHGVSPLPSPPGYPQYNGGIERTIGATHAALQRYHILPNAAPWHPEAIARTLEHLNSRRPRGHGGKTARTLWDERVDINPCDRERFLAEAACITAACEARRESATNKRRPSDSEIQRIATSATAQLQNYLSITRGR